MNKVARSAWSLGTILGVFISVLAGASRVSGYDARLNWSPVAGTAGYKVYLRQGGQHYGPGTDLGALSPDADGVVRYVATGLPVDITYYFVVTRYNTSKVESAFSNEVSLTIRSAALGVVAAESTARPHHHQALDPSRARSAAVIADAGMLPGPPAAVGNFEGDGDTDLVVGEAADGPAPHDRVRVYRMQPDRRPQLLGEMAAFAGSNISSSSNLSVGDVVACERGDEVVVADDGRHRRASVVRIFGGFVAGTPHLLVGFRALPARAAARRPLAYALADVLPDSDHPGQEIVVGDRFGRVYVFGIRSAGTEYTTCDVEAVLLGRFAAFPDLPGAAGYSMSAGDLMPGNPGDEIAVENDGLVRVLDGGGLPLLEFAAVAAGSATKGLRLRIADVIPALAGAELIVGEGGMDGLRVFTVAHGVPTQVLDVADPRQLVSFWPQLAASHLIGDVR